MIDPENEVEAGDSVFLTTNKRKKPKFTDNQRKKAIWDFLEFNFGCKVKKL